MCRNQRLVTMCDAINRRLGGARPRMLLLGSMAVVLCLVLFSGVLAGAESSGINIDVPPSVLPPARMAWHDGQDPMGNRLFRTTSARTQMDLAGFWDFITDPSGTGESHRYFENFPTPETTLRVPGTWNAEPRYMQYKGIGWYHRDFEVPKDGDMLLHFSGVFYKAKVWLDGKYLGENEESYLPFTFLVRNIKTGSHSLVVSADNRLNDTTLPQEQTDWFPYGGIDRPVYAEMVPATFINQIQVSTISASPSEAHLRSTVWVQSSGTATSETVSLYIDNKKIYSEQRQIRPGENKFSFDVNLPNPKLWSPEVPNLYSARLVIGRDDQFTRFGVRTITVRGERILLNGRVIKIRGVNRHEDYPGWGSAVPPNLIRQDVEIIKRLGANAIRIHYPVSEMLLDYCDQNGLLFLSELPSWQYRPEQLHNPVVQAKIKHYFYDMVKRDAGHPSILYWSLGNEFPNPDASYDVIKGLVDYAHQVDPSHLITLVTGGGNIDRVEGLLDIICTNWAVYQWYHPPSYLDAKAGESSIAHLMLIHKRYPNKPVILTEFGGAESQAGWHSWGNVKWSVEFQTKNVVESARYALGQNWISGGCVWQFADSRTAPDRVLKGRLHGWNAKGIVDAYRNPKLTFYGLQEVYRSFAADSAR